MLPAEHLGHSPRPGEGDHERGDRRGAEHPEPEEQDRAAVAEERGQCPGDVTDAVEVGTGVCRADRGGNGDHDGDHDDLGGDRAQRGVQARGAQGCGDVLLAMTFVDHGLLLVDDHPRHDHGPDVGGQQHQELAGRLHGARQPADHGMGLRVCQQRGWDEQQLERDRGEPDRHGPRQSDHRPDAGQARELGDESSQACGEQGGGGQQGPRGTEGAAGERPVPLSRQQPESRRDLLDHLQDGNQDDLRQDQLVPVPCAGLRRGDDAAGVRLTTGTCSSATKPRLT
ncbi:hypothetical protein GALL_337530 [mine drainage metagenome]|uniref:Uncharacterized protein n=1 Tax=mine drainage metagenome TaxID=410659 RepID=A0A1J5QM50_9ZZZZ